MPQSDSCRLLGFYWGDQWWAGGALKAPGCHFNERTVLLCSLDISKRQMSASGQRLPMGINEKVENGFSPNAEKRWDFSSKQMMPWHCLTTCNEVGVFVWFLLTAVICGMYFDNWHFTVVNFFFYLYDRQKKKKWKRFTSFATTESDGNQHITIDCVRHPTVVPKGQCLCSCQC